MKNVLTVPVPSNLATVASNLNLGVILRAYRTCVLASSTVINNEDRTVARDVLGYIPKRPTPTTPTANQIPRCEWKWTGRKQKRTKLLLVQCSSTVQYRTRERLSIEYGEKFHVD
jgi:hypothetical protein